MPLQGGIRGEWSDVRPRKTKALEQVQGRRDIQRDDQRLQATRFRRLGRSRVRDRVDYADRFDSGADIDHGNQELTDDGRVTIHYLRPERPRARDNLRYEDGFVLECRRSPASFHEHAANNVERRVFHQQRRKSVLREPVQNSKVHQLVVSFYFTNIPHDISYAVLRQGFEVCGILEDVYLARKRNVNGGAFGFVRYAKVKDVEKLLKAVNNVWFGDWKVVAKVATFDRSRNSKGVDKGREHVELEGEKRKEGRGKEDEGVVRKYGGKEVDEGGPLEKKKVVKETDVTKMSTVENLQVHIPKYTSAEQDVLWASRCLVATVLNGEAIPVLQRRIFDAGFEKLDIIPLGADKVLLRTEDDSDVNLILSEAPAFFEHFFSKPVKWKKDVVVRERGAWVRIYGVPLQAWNLDFFKLCVYDCGRLLKVDEATLDKIHFDYARVLVSTHSLDLINADAKVLVDGTPFDFKIVEEGGFSLGEDACLSDEDVSTEEDGMVEDRNQEDCFVNDDVDNLVHNLSEEWLKEQQVAKASHASPNKENSLFETVPLEADVTKGPCAAAVSFTEPKPSEDVSEHQAARNISLCDISKAPNFKSHSLGGVNKKVQRTSSCPPGRVHSVSAGPWSLEWAKRHKEVVKISLPPVTIVVNVGRVLVRFAIVLSS